MIVVRSLVLSAVLVTGLAAADPARAGFLFATGDTVRFTNGPGASPGGSFWAQNVTVGKVSPVQYMQTFCLERNETIQFSVNYTITIDTAAIQGGVSGGNPDPLDARTAYLFSNYHHGTLSAALSSMYSGSTFDMADSSDNTALQNAIWKIEGEISTTLSGKALKLFNLATANHNNTLLEVRVMNLWQGSTPRQSQLTMVPEPSSLTLAGMGLACVLGRFARKRRRASQRAA